MIYNLNKKITHVKHIKLFEQFVNEDVKIGSKITEDQAQELLEFLKQTIGTKLNWKEVYKWVGASELGKYSKEQLDFLNKNYLLEIVDVEMSYYDNTKKAMFGVIFKQNAPWYVSSQDVKIKLFKDNPDFEPQEFHGHKDTNEYSHRMFACDHDNKQLSRLSDITKIGRFGI